MCIYYAQCCLARMLHINMQDNGENANVEWIETVLNPLIFLIYFPPILVTYLSIVKNAVPILVSKEKCSELPCGSNTGFHYSTYN